MDHTFMYQVHTLIEYKCNLRIFLKYIIFMICKPLILPQYCEWFFLSFLIHAVVKGDVSAFEC